MAALIAAALVTVSFAPASSWSNGSPLTGLVISVLFTQPCDLPAWDVEHGLPAGVVVRNITTGNRLQFSTSGCGCLTVATLSSNRWSLPAKIMPYCADDGCH